MLSRLKADKFSGIFPEAGIIVGRSFSKEEVKDFLFQRMTNPCLTDAVLSLEDLAKKILGIQEWIPQPTRVLAIEQIYRKWSRLRPFPGLQKLKRRRRFFERLDYAIQKTRLLAASTAEEQVFLETLEFRGRKRELHAEIFLIARAYEAWLEESNLWDSARAYDAAIELLKTKGWPESVHLPKKWYFLESLSRYRSGRQKNFIEELSRWSELEDLSSDAPEIFTSSFQWKQHHTAWDAADELARFVLTHKLDHSIIIAYSENFENRRALWETFKNYGIPLEDPRDPLDVRLDERNKKLWIPFELISSGFEVSSLVYYFQAIQDEKFPVRELYSRGNERGCPISPYKEWIIGFSEKWIQKRKTSDWKTLHADWVETSGVFKAPEDRVWVRQLLKEIWDRLISESEMLGLSERTVSHRWILERVRLHLKLLSGRSPALRPEKGVRLYRFEQQCIDDEIQTCIIFGWSSREWDMQPESNFYLNAQEQNSLHQEFGIESPEQKRLDRIAAAKRWFLNSKKIICFDYSINSKGKSRDSIKSMLVEIGVPLTEEDQPENIPPTRLWSHSYRALHPERSRDVVLETAHKQTQDTLIQVSATDLDRFSKCPFLSLTGTRWNLWDFRPPGFEPYPEVRGSLIHLIVQKIVELNLTDYSSVLNAVFESTQLKGMVESPRLKERFLLKVKNILDRFLEKESEYRLRSGVQPVFLDNVEVKARFPTGIVFGKPDRVDEYEDGYFIIDYKTSSKPSPNAKKMIEKAYALQLPAYVIALRQEYKRPVYGFQFVELNNKAGRTNGVFFETWNGKESGKLTHFSKKVISLLNKEPDSIWNNFEEQIENELQQIKLGIYSSKPKDPKDCPRCPMKVTCGEHRRFSAMSGFEAIEE